MSCAVFGTPEEAARDGFPDQHARIVAFAREADDAYALLDTGPDGAPHLYGVCVEKRDGGWVSSTSGNGPGWSLTDEESGLGTHCDWDETPPGTTHVRLVADGETAEAPVANGVYLIVRFRVSSDAPLPRVEAFRIADRWIAASPVEL